MNEDFKRLLCVGHEKNSPVFCTVTYKNKRLSITGVIGPHPNGSSKGGCGQITLDLTVINPNHKEGWTVEKIQRLKTVWSKYHLNDMQAGSPAQTKYLRDAYVPNNTESHYEWAVRVLKEAGLNPDPDYLHNGKPYQYGHAWLYIDVPEDVLNWLRSMPDTELHYNWA